MRDALYGTSELEGRREVAAAEVETVASLIDQAIGDNARVAQDQDAYQRRYDALATRYDEARAVLDAMEAELERKSRTRDAIQMFLDRLDKQPARMEAFDEEAFCALADHLTVHEDGRITVTFRNGTEVEG